MEQPELVYPSFDVERAYVFNEGLEWCQVELSDGRVVTMLIPEEYQEVTKCHMRSKCTNWSCIKCYDSSFMSSDIDIVRTWRNDISPRLVAKQCNNKFKFWCEYCNHARYQKIQNVSIHGRRCTFCAGQKLCDSISCMHCYQRSFASHEKCIYWSQNNILTARQVSKSGDSQKFLFKCVCDHEFDSTLYNIVHNDQWCSYCSSKRLCDKVCTFCYDKSFASHERCKFWSSKNTETPRNVFKACSSKKYWFDCRHGHQFDAKPGSITSGGTWCPRCKDSKLELAVFDFLKVMNIIFKHEHSLPNSRFRYDFYIEDRRLLIECDGIQHFECVPHFHRASENETEHEHFERKQQVDRDKDTLSRNNGMYLIRLDHTLTTEPEKIVQILEHLLGMNDAIPDELQDKIGYCDNIWYSDANLYQHLLTK